MRVRLGLLVGLSALIALGTATVYAGGWAVTTLDAVPSEFNAGESYRIGYTIRQHGETPFVGATTAIEVRSGNGPWQRFTAQPDGTRGHYVADVIFPDAGEWQWRVDQSPFAPQALGSVTVVAPAISTVAPATSNAALALLPWLVMSTALAALVFAWRLLVYLRISRRLATSGVTATR
jgi:Kef-type K+ transport system membrane component KefB